MYAACFLRKGKPPRVCYWNMFDPNGLIRTSYYFNSWAEHFTEDVYHYDAQNRLVESKHYALHLPHIAQNHPGGLEAALAVKKTDDIATWTLNAEGRFIGKQGAIPPIDFAALARAYGGDYRITAYRYDAQNRCIEETERTPWQFSAT